MTGPVPKPPAQRRRRNAEPPHTTLDPSKKVSAPKLPGADGYDARTVAWYKVWSSCPQASTFVSTDWQRLHMLAPLVDQYWLDPKKDLMAEIRLNESLLGAAAADRMRLRWDLAADEPAKAGAAPKAGTRDRQADAMRLIRGEAG